jgi:hypothetical protein
MIFYFMRLLSCRQLPSLNGFALRNKPVGQDGIKGEMRAWTATSENVCATLSFWILLDIFNHALA